MKPTSLLAGLSDQVLLHVTHCLSVLETQLYLELRVY